jgi:hypothetical protein
VAFQARARHADPRPQDTPSAERGVHCSGGSIPHIGEHVRIYVQGEAYVGVPQELLDKLGVDALLRFTYQYGLPCGSSREDPNVYGLRRPEQLTLQRFFEESQRAWVVVSLYESVLNRDEDTARSLLTDYRHLDDVFQENFHMLNREFPEDQEPATPLQCALVAAVFSVDPVVRELCEQSIGVHIDGMAQPDPSAVKLHWRFDNLLGAMYLQMHWLLTSGGNLVRCEHCRRVISLARPHPDGRKRRRDKRFCDDACRQGHYRSKKRSADNSA